MSGHASKNSNWDRVHAACAPSYKVPELVQPPYAFRSLAAAPPPNALQTSMAAAPTAEAPSEARLNLYQSAALLAGLTTADVDRVILASGGDLSAAGLAILGDVVKSVPIREMSCTIFRLFWCVFSFLPLPAFAVRKMTRESRELALKTLYMRCTGIGSA